VRAQLRFYEELNDFLPKEKRRREFDCEFLLPGSVKDLIENLNVPHTEVDLILANGASVGFDYLVQHGDRISVYPQFESLDISPLLRLRPRPLREPRFVLDCHLGRLARYLRMLGFDTLYRNDYDDETLLQISLDQRRILLTRDLGLLKRRQLERGYFVRARKSRQQAAEVVHRLQLESAVQPFTRCMSCNGALEKVDKRDIEQRLPLRTRQFFDEFLRCTDCRRIFWKGSHYERMQRLINEVGQAPFPRNFTPLSRGD
jgi:hypothetical protein